VPPRRLIHPTEESTPREPILMNNQVRRRGMASLRVEKCDQADALILPRQGAVPNRTTVREINRGAARQCFVNWK